MLFGPTVRATLRFPDLLRSRSDGFAECTGRVGFGAGHTYPGSLAAPAFRLPKRFADRFAFWRRHICRVSAAAHGVAAMLGREEEPRVSAEKFEMHTRRSRLPRRPVAGNTGRSGYFARAGTRGVGVPRYLWLSLRVRIRLIPQCAARPIAEALGDVDDGVMGPCFVRLSPSDKLAALRRLDDCREWHSLSDERVCLACGSRINGDQIQLSGGIDDLQPLRAHCPTRGCAATPADWALASGRAAAARASQLDQLNRRTLATSKRGARGAGTLPGRGEAERIAHSVLRRAWRAFLAARA